MNIILPDDIIHLICSELWVRKDFVTLFKCAATSKRVAFPALSSLYRIHHESSVTEGEFESGDIINQERAVEKWSLMWRSIILSSLPESRTAFPYAQFMRAIDLRNLNHLLDSDKFKGKIRRRFFEGELAQFEILQEKISNPRTKTRSSFVQVRLNINAILEAVGEVLTKHTPLLERLEAHTVGSNSLTRWAIRLPRLQRLAVWDGEALTLDVQEAIQNNCKDFNTLSVFHWYGDCDHQLANFLNGLRPNTLKTLETHSRTDISTESCTALNTHGKSLKHLKLNFRPETVEALEMLRGCTSIEAFQLTFDGPVDLEANHSTLLLETISWLRHCKLLRSLILNEVKSGPKIVTPLLLEDEIHLETLEIDLKRDPYSIKDYGDFHDALSHQKNLQELLLRGDGEDSTPEDIEILIASLVQLHNLTILRLHIVDDAFFSDACVIRLAFSLPRLETLSVGGFNISDLVLGPIAGLSDLKNLTFHGVSNFTLNGLLDFISNLKPSNQDISVAIDMADPSSLLTDVDLALIRDVLAEKVGGKLEYIPMRDPDISEYEGDSD